VSDVENYLKWSHRYLRESEDLIKKRDSVQASEKFRGAAAQIVKAVTAKRGIELKAHGELHRFVVNLKDELNDPELPMLFSTTAALHHNSYENWLPPEVVKKLEAVVNREGDNK